MITTLQKRIKISYVCVLLFAVLGLAVAQLPKLPDVPKGITERIPSLDNILKSEPPITTSLSDAVTEISFLDDFGPPILSPLTLLPRNNVGAFILDRTGLFAITIESYCLKAAPIRLLEETDTCSRHLKDRKHILSESYFRQGTNTRTFLRDKSRSFCGQLLHAQRLVTCQGKTK